MNDAEQPVETAASSGTRIGQVLVIAGLFLLYGVGAYWVCAEVILGDTDEPWWLKIGLPAVVVGISILFVIVLLQRLKAAKTDKYTDVKD